MNYSGANQWRSGQKRLLRDSSIAKSENHVINKIQESDAGSICQANVAFIIDQVAIMEESIIDDG